MPVPSTVTVIEGHDQAIRAATAAIGAAVGDAPDRAVLAMVGEQLRALAARALPWDMLRLPAGALSAVHLLGLGDRDRVALYAVADAPGTRSIPHVHHTWSVTIGVEGVEANTFFAHDGARCLARLGSQQVGPGDVAIMTEAEAHATEVVSAAPMLHLHVYGRPIHVLAPFATRVLAPLA
ncbi:MAG: hypothetical protein K8W52_45280 [Deltaproteobacteria bacterium]|nr:hypothetical protein [Deltaproteobacteria bacterium]